MSDADPAARLPGEGYADHRARLEAALAHGGHEVKLRGAPIVAFGDSTPASLNELREKVEQLVREHYAGRLVEDVPVVVVQDNCRCAPTYSYFIGVHFRVKCGSQ